MSFAFSSARRRVSNARFVGSVSAFSSSLNLSILARMILRIPTYHRHSMAAATRKDEERWVAGRGALRPTTLLRGG